MYRRTSFLAATALLATVAGDASAQAARSTDEGDLLLRVNAPVTIASVDTASTVWVIGGDLDVQGTVRDQVIVMGGRARISGSVDGGVVVFNGALDLAPTARVDRDVFLYRSSLTRSEGAVVDGDIDFSRGPAFGQLFALGFWLSTSLVVVVFGLLFAAVAGGGLNRSTDILVREPGPSVITAIVTWVGIPLLAALSFATVIGIPLGIAMLVFLLPALGFLGLVVSGNAVGRMLLGERATDVIGEHSWREVVVGLAVLMLLGFVPLLGGLIVMLASTIGAGALVYRVWNGMRGSRAPSLRPIEAH